MKIPLNRQNKIAVLKWLKQGYIETKDIPDVDKGDPETITINCAYNTDDDVIRDYIHILIGRKLTPEQVDEELERVRREVLK